MTQYTITTNAELTAEYFGLLAATAPFKIGQVVTQSANDLKNIIQSRVPVRTGRLRDSIYIENNTSSPFRYEAYVGSDVEYASAVEFGTGTSAPNPYMRSSINAFEPIFIASLWIAVT